MEKRSVDDVESRMGPAAVARPLSDALGTTNLAVNHYELDPGDSFAYGLHAHADQEELFYVESGTVTFETRAGTVEATAGDVVRFGPGEYQRGINRGDERVSALAVGAPREAGETEILRGCEECGERTPQSIELSDDRDAVIAVCEECGSETGRFD